MRLWRKLVERKNVLATGIADLSLSRGEGPTQAVGAGTHGRSSRALGERWTGMEHVGGVYWSKEIMADMGRREEKEWRARWRLNQG